MRKKKNKKYRVKSAVYNIERLFRSPTRSSRQVFNPLYTHVCILYTHTHTHTHTDTHRHTHKRLEKLFKFDRYKKMLKVAVGHARLCYPGQEGGTQARGH